MVMTKGKTGMVQYLSRKLMPLATGIALLIAFLAPVTYWIMEHHKLGHLTAIYAEDLADKLRLIALESPELWKYQTYKFITITDGFHPGIEVSDFRILDEKGEVIIGHDQQKISGEGPEKKLSFMKELRFTLGTAPIIFNGRQAGTVEVFADDTAIVRTSLLLFIFWSLAGTGLALLVYRFPLKVVRKMTGEIEALISTVQKSEARLHSLLENIPDVAWTSDQEGESVFISAKSRDVIGYTSAEICAAAGSLWLDNIHPEDRARVKKALENLFTQGEAFDEEYRYRRKDGIWIWLHDRATNSYERDGKLYADGLFSDITAHKQMEEALASATDFARIVMDSIDDAISIVDVSDYRIMGCNAAFLKKTGLPREEVVGRQCYELTHHRSEPCSPPCDICPLLETVATRTYAVAEHCHFRENGDKYYVEVSTEPIFDRNGTMAKVVHVARDITERKRIEEEIRKLNEELEIKVEEKSRELLYAQEELVRKEKLAILGQLSGSVGHELRNPLGVMSNAVYYLKMVHADADETTREYLDIIKNEIDNALRIITDLLDFARNRTPQRQPVTAAVLVRQSLERCSIPKNVAVAVDIPDGLPSLNIDPLQLRQVLINFITNAVQAMPDGGALRVAARLVGASPPCGCPEAGGHGGPSLQDCIEISVADTGEGITPENMKRLFQPLFTTKSKGIGLGLVACRNLVEANGGRIEVASEPGKGTTFMVLLPIERGAKYE